MNSLKGAFCSHLVPEIQIKFLKMMDLIIVNPKQGYNISNNNNEEEFFLWTRNLLKKSLIYIIIF